ncbi:MAG: excinuclease ABC subunit UvrA [Deltaproteobacteria bacterium]|nr:excinuclease ABC subunit UvrA [Deltaproteobacteria bacterium]
MNRTVLSVARTHNLKGISLQLEGGELVAVTGVSGAGKSSLCIDTLYAEGQRRFVESFSPYARQFLERHERPPIDKLDPVPAAVAVDRRAPVKSSRSTVATMADVEPYLSALFLREALPMCPDCKVVARHIDAAQAASQALEGLKSARVLVVYPRRVEGTAAYLEARDSLVAAGNRRVLVAGAVRDLDEVRPSEVLGAGGQFDVVLDRVTVGSASRLRVQEAFERGWREGGGVVAVVTEDGARRLVRQGLVCPSCARAFEPARPGLFSYQSPVGACSTCKGFGRVIGLDLRKVIPDPGKSLNERVIRPWSGKAAQWERRVMRKYCERMGIDMDLPWALLTEAQRNAVLDGEGTWKGKKYPGVRLWFKWMEGRAYKMHVRVFLSRYRSYDPCPTCDGKRLNESALSYRIDGMDLSQWHGLELREVVERLERLPTRNAQGDLIRRELVSRVGFLCEVGLGYLTLDRQARTLSGGEAQRVSLTAALGASLTGALIVLDEPTVGLHVTDIPPLVRTMRTLADNGNSVLVVEHEPSVIRATDRVIDLGPGAGARGGEILFSGTPAALAKRSDLPTGRALADLDANRKWPRRTPRSWLTVRNARANNLAGLDVRLPLGVVCALSGPSGSGKSTLAEEVLYRAVAAHLSVADVEPAGDHDRIEGLESLYNVVLVDQAPLGRTSRGNPATYTKAWDRIRDRFANEPSAKSAGFGPSHFSFNVSAGRCEACSGEGYETVEMQFLADVSLLCPVCRGKRFRSEVLEVRYRGRSVADVLQMTVDEVLEWADDDAHLTRSLQPLTRLGLGYLPLGQPLSTLSGGEAQRLKLARALRGSVDGTLFVLDEPSAGLHPEDVGYLVDAMHDLASRGASVIVVDHDLQVIRACDWVVDLGPGAGRDGGNVVAEGTPEHIAQGKGRTALALREAALPAARSARKAADRPAVGDAIQIQNAREHNLREVTCAIPKEKLVVVTGPSGSGKSTLVFDVMFAEGQRRFLETLTPYARQFLPVMPKPDVDRVVGLPPSIALEQRRSRSGGNSTVATVTEVAHYLRLLFAKVGTAYCPNCDVPVSALTGDEVLARVHATPGKGMLLAPVVQARKGVYMDLLTSASRAGIEQARVDGAVISTDKPPRLAKTREHTIDLIVYEGPFARVPREALESALHWAKGLVRVAGPRGEEILSTTRACPSCGTGIPELDPRWFSFNTKQGACEDCQGTGKEYEGSSAPCTSCEGSRLAPIPRGVRVHDRRYHEVVGQSVHKAREEIRAWKFTGDRARIAGGALSELIRRVDFLNDVGLGYLGLDRDAGTLSGGEMQRLRLSAQLGAGLTGALYVLDEPTIGLHPSDTSRLLRNLRALVDTGSTVVVVEHDADTIRAADHIVDLGPSGGRGGGRVVAQGAAADVLADPASPTGHSLRDHRMPPASVRGAATEHVVLTGARAHNLKGIHVRIPLGRLTVVAGVSGSGKSTLVQKILYPAVRKALKLVADPPLAHDRLQCPASLIRAASVDQLPIGRTPRSVPATFLGIWDDIRRLFAATPEAQVKGFGASRFSFNSAAAGGRCTTCDGQGVLSHEMSFLPDVITACDACHGSRFESATLEIRYRGLTIGDVLRLTAEEAREFFTSHSRISRPLQTLCDLGVGYVQLGQGSHTLSGGEAQRLKLALELTASGHHRPTLYVLDEPTTGLHLSDVARLVTVLHQLVDRGDTLVVVEHHPDVIAAADHVIELGPEGGDAGGRIVAEGAPADVMAAGTATGKVLRALARNGSRREPVKNPRATGLYGQV